MNFVSVQFIAFAFATVVLYHISRSRRAKQFVLALSTSYFITTYTNGPASAVPLLLFLLVGFVLICAARESRDKTSLFVSVSVLLAAFVYLKQFFFLKCVGLPFIYTTVGLSYILFRIIGLLVEVSNGEIKSKPSLLEYYLYTCNFLCFLSGPVQRWEEFRDEQRAIKEPISDREVMDALSRMALGFVKLAVIAGAFDYVFQNLSVQFISEPVQVDWLKFVFLYTASAAAYTGYLYYNFSGYMDIVIGLGRMMQIDVPENFNKPFTSKSFLEFWQRWHMTMSQWFKSYLFTPLMISLMKRFPSSKASAYVGLSAFFVTFLVMGIWHGSTLVFVVYGLLMALGACANKIWQLTLPRFIGKPSYKALQKNVLYGQACAGLTFSFFTLALTCLWINEIGQLFALTARLGPTGVAIALSSLAALFAIGASIARALGGAFAKVPFGGTIVSGTTFAAVRCALAFLSVLFVSSMLTKAPEFVYKAF
ncbi:MULTISPECIES: MBOAT family O-acyltransferase [unclassified Methylobacterium]|uniref:MBOAT family O-acyltransferase n=1 Tax=unclassified Methylobacterium TaxID=2615210 RepID=UPI00226A3AE2|nr:MULTISPECIES: MBOAT family O-acyltransferase [unclassified Methylobacterium]